MSGGGREQAKYRSADERMAACKGHWSNTEPPLEAVEWSPRDADRRPEMTLRTESEGLPKNE
jgi:hypothetical protein